MTTSTSKAVPRSRLNITYRTQIDGQVVRKELPLRLLIAGDFSGRAASVLGIGEHARPLPHLSQRIMYSIGKEGSVESILARARVSLPIPGDGAERRFALMGEATVRVERSRDAAGQGSFELSIKSSKIRQAVELRADAPGAAATVAPDSPLYSGELSSNAFTIVSDGTLPAWPAIEPKVGTAVSAWKERHDAVAASFLAAAVPAEKGRFWLGAEGTELHGWLAPPVSPAGEPASVFELSGREAKIWFQFESEFSDGFSGQGRQSAEFRVSMVVTDITGRAAIGLPNMDALSPERVALAVPKIRRLLVIRWLASQGRSLLSSNPVLRTEVKLLLEQQKPFGASQAVATAAAAAATTAAEAAAKAGAAATAAATAATAAATAVTAGAVTPDAAAANAAAAAATTALKASEAAAAKAKTSAELAAKVKAALDAPPAAGAVAPTAATKTSADAAATKTAAAQVKVAAAQVKAAAAQDKAAAAQVKAAAVADAATAGDAKTAADEAKTAADEAKTAADDAKTAADEAKTAAEAPTKESPWTQLVAAVQPLDLANFKLEEEA